MQKQEPKIFEIRQRIESVLDEEKRLALQFEFLAAARRSEVCGKWGYLAEDTSLEEYEGQEVALFQVQTAKRKGKIRPVALPLSNKYEPWTQNLYEYMNKIESGRAFKFEDKTLYRAAKENFEGCTYFINQYSVADYVVEQHWRDFATHGLRHLRAKNLIDQYGFDGYQLSTYCGWSLSSTVRGVPMVVEKYINLQWRDYITKLFKEIKPVQ